MTITSLGSLSLGVALPGALACQIAGELGINLALPDIQARLSALLAFSPSLGDFSVDLALTAQIAADINAAISIGLTPPSLSLQLAIIAALIVDLTNAVLQINLQLTIVLGFGALLLNAGIAGYAFAGAQNVLGSELATALGGSTAHANAVILVTQNAATWTAMQAVFKTS